MLFSYSTVLAASLLLLNSPVLSKKAKKNKPSKAFALQEKSSSQIWLVTGLLI
jgi:hypothetical protein